MITVAGISICKGRPKVRLCSDLVLRIKNLQRQGDTDIMLIELPHPMNKADACRYLLNSGLFDRFTKEINEVIGKKHLPSPSKKNIIKPVVEVDQELQAIKELAEV